MGCSSGSLPLDDTSCQKSCPSAGFLQFLPLVFPLLGSPQVVSSFRTHSVVLLWGSSRAAGGSPRVAGGQPDSPWSVPVAAGNLCPNTWSTSSLSAPSLVSAGLFHSDFLIPLSQLLCKNFLPCLKYIMAEVLPVGSALAWLWPVASPSWRR